MADVGDRGPSGVDCHGELEVTIVVVLELHIKRPGYADLGGWRGEEYGIFPDFVLDFQGEGAEAGE